MGKGKTSQRQEMDNTEDGHAVKCTSRKPTKPNGVNYKGNDSQETKPVGSDIAKSAEQALPTIQEEQHKYSEDTEETSKVEVNDKHKDLDDDKPKDKDEQPHGIKQEIESTQDARMTPVTKEEIEMNLDAIRTRHPTAKQQKWLVRAKLLDPDHKMTDFLVQLVNS